MTVGSTTRLIAMIGHPIAQAKSPQTFNTHFADRNEDRVMIPVDLLPGEVEPFMRVVRGWQNLDGLVVTLPHKSAVARLVDEVTPRARFLEAVNVVHRASDGRLFGDMTDGEGFVRAARDNGFAASGRSALIVGAGAAGRAIAQALAEEGLRELSITDIDRSQSAAFADRLRSAFPDLALHLDIAPEASFDLVVNASPCGMQESDPLPVPDRVLSQMAANGLVADVVTSPQHTRLLQAASAYGRKIQFGHEMAKAQFCVLGSTLGVLDEGVQHD